VQADPGFFYFVIWGQSTFCGNVPAERFASLYSCRQANAQRIQVLNMSLKPLIEKVL
jgi:hypothetical protein